MNLTESLIKENNLKQEVVVGDCYVHGIRGQRELSHLFLYKLN